MVIDVSKVVRMNECDIQHCDILVINIHILVINIHLNAPGEIMHRYGLNDPSTAQLLI